MATCMVTEYDTFTEAERLNYLLGARVIFENILNALKVVYDRDLGLILEDHAQEFTYLIGQLLSLPNSRQNERIKDNFQKLLKAEYFSSDTFQGWRTPLPDRGGKPIYKVTLKDWVLNEKYDFGKSIIFIDTTMVELTSENNEFVIKCNVAQNFKAREPEAKWKVLYNIREWRNNKLGHRKVGEGVCISDEDLCQLYEWAEQFHRLFNLDESYLMELLDIQQSAYDDRLKKLQEIIEKDSLYNEEQIIQFSILDSLEDPKPINHWNRYYKYSKEFQVFNEFYNKLLQAILDLYQDEEIIKILIQYKVISDAEKRNVEAIDNRDIKFHEIMKMCYTAIKKAVKPSLRLLQMLRAFRRFPQLDHVTLEMISKAEEKCQPRFKYFEADVKPIQEKPCIDEAPMQKELDTSIPKYMEDYVKALKCQYLKPIPNSAKFPPLESTQWKFVDLHLLDKNTSGRIDLVVDKGLDRPFNLGIDGGKRVLIEGAPGVGKSTLAYEIGKAWAKGEAFHRYEYVILILLRKRRVHCYKDLKDLFQKSDVYKYIKEKSFRNTLFILDGYDELPSALQRKSVFYDIITEDISSECEFADVIITSRPWAVHNFKTSIFLYHFELRGLTDASINNYIDSSLPDVKQRIELHKAIATSPQTKSLLYVPLNLVCFVELFKKQGLPDTLTSLYNSLVSTLVRRHLEENNIPRTKFKRGDYLSLPQKEKIAFLSICQQAYGQLNNQQSPDLLAEITETFGLLIKKPQDMLDSDVYPEPTFQHNSIQYFLAAYFISLKSPEQVALHFEKKFDQKYFQVILFMCGLMKSTLSHNMLKSYFDYLLGEKKDEHNPDIGTTCKITFRSLLFFHMLFEAKMESAMVEFLNREDLVVVQRTINLPSPHDLYVLGRCIRFSNCKWELGFTRRHLTYEHVSMFQQGLCSVDVSHGHIDEVRLGYNPICSKSLEVLHTFPTSEIRYLRRLDIRGAGLDSDACTILAKHLHKFTRLETLLLNENNIEYGQHMPLIEAINQSRSIKNISLTSLTSDECIKLLVQDKLEKVKLMQMLGLDLKNTLECRCKSSIKKLKIRCSEIHVGDLEELPEALQAMENLTSLSFVNCGITSPATKIIAKAVAYHPTINILRLQDNLIDDGGGAHLGWLLYKREERGFKLKNLRTDHNPLSGRRDFLSFKNLYHRYKSNQCYD